MTDVPASNRSDVRDRLTSLEGRVNALDLRAPKDPGVIPVLVVEVNALKEQYKSLEAKVDKVLDRLNSLAIKVAVATALTSGIITYWIQHA